MLILQLLTHQTNYLRNNLIIECIVERSRESREQLEHLVIDYLR